MKRGITLALLAALALATAVPLANGATARQTIPLKEAKLNIEHNATDHDTGFQGALDSEGWRTLDVKGPDGIVLTLRARGELAKLGMTELFFETVEPENADVPLDELLETLPEGEYLISGTALEDGVNAGPASGIALLTHVIPAGPVLVTPEEDSTVLTTGVIMS